MILDKLIHFPLELYRKSQLGNKSRGVQITPKSQSVIFTVQTLEVIMNALQIQFLNYHVMKFYGLDSSFKIFYVLTPVIISRIYFMAKQK